MPTPAPTALALSAATDTGDSQSDGITKADNLVVVGSAQASSSVQIYVDGASSGSACTADGSGAFSCQLGTVTAGTKSVTAKATGVNGESTASQSLTIVVDRTAPTVSWNSTSALGPNSSTSIQLTISENTTTLSFSDLGVLCTSQDGCVISNFSGSNRTFTVTYAHVNNSANGGAVRLTAESFSDVAGNTNSLTGVTVVLDSTGPYASFTRNGSSLTIDFGELVFGFENEDLYFTRHGYSNNGDETYQGGPYNYLSQDPNNPNIWYCDLPPGIDIYYGITTWVVEIGGAVTDADGFQVQTSRWQIPLIDNR